MSWTQVEKFLSSKNLEEDYENAQFSIEEGCSAVEQGSV